MSRIENIAPSGMKLRFKLRALLNPNNWRREFKFERQRKQRGWSDRDTWNGGEYILEVVSGILKYLADEKVSHTDWPEYFKTNYPNNQGYNNLEQVAKDIDDYLAFDEYAWGDTLGFDVKYNEMPLSNGTVELVSGNTPEEERQIKEAIQASHKEWQRRYKKASKAMTFVAINFHGLWD